MQKRQLRMYLFVVGYNIAGDRNRTNIGNVEYLNPEIVLSFFQYILHTKNLTVLKYMNDNYRITVSSLMNSCEIHDEKTITIGYSKFGSLYYRTNIDKLIIEI